MSSALNCKKSKSAIDTAFTLTGCASPLQNRHQLRSTGLLMSIDCGLCRQLEAQPFIEKDLFALDFCTPADKEIAQLGGVVIASERGVEREKDFSTGGEVLLQIAQKKIPFRRSPKSFHRIMEIKIDRERSNPIELLIKLGQRLECFNRPNNAPDTEKIEEFGEERELIQIKAKDRMTELFQDEQKESTSATEVEHAFRLRAMEFQILHPFAIDP